MRNKVITKAHYTVEEYKKKVVQLTPKEYELLTNNFCKYLTVTRIGERDYEIKAGHYVGDILLDTKLISIEPKIGHLNFFYMLNKIFDIKPFIESEIAYKKERTLFAIIIEYFVSLVRDLARKGISRSYYEVEEDLPIVRGRIMITENLRKNIASPHMNFCRYADFGPDNTENQIVKFTIYHLFRSILPREDLGIAIKGLFHHFDAVSYVPISISAFPSITFTSLNRHYEPIINLCKILLQNMTVNLEHHDDTSFSSLMIDMNIMFEHFVFALFRDSQMADKWVMRGGRNKESSYSDIEEDTEILPDITIGSDNKLIVVDAKYKTEFSQANDLNQIWVYCIALGARSGVLIYPKHELEASPVFTHTLRGKGTPVFIRTIDLQKANYSEFQKECDMFVEKMSQLIDNTPVAG